MSVISILTAPISKVHATLKNNFVSHQSKSRLIDYWVFCPRLYKKKKTN